MNLRVSPAARDDLTELSRLLNRSQTATVEMALRHLLSTVLRDQPVYLTVPRGPAESSDSQAR